MAVNFAKQPEPNSGRARPQGPRRDADLRCCRSAFSFVIQSMISADFGFRRIRAGMAHNPRSCTGGDRVGESAFYVTGSILTRQAHAFPIRELHATCVASFFGTLSPPSAKSDEAASAIPAATVRLARSFHMPSPSLHRGSCPM
jgi:hypothetical protein